VPRFYFKAAVAALCAVAALAAGCARAGQPTQPVGGSGAPAPLKVVVPSDQNEAKIALGKQLFYETRLSGDRGLSCVACHVPDKGWADGKPLSDGYPGTKYFRNTPTLLNVATDYTKLDWDGRFTVSDMDSLVRDRLTESHFGMVDGRLMAERLKQVPEYEAFFKAAFGAEPNFSRTLSALSTFVKTLKTEPNPYDQYLKGDKSALAPDAARGAALFIGKANCIQCHAGPNLTDGKSYNLGVPENPDILKDPLRIITMRKFLRTMGAPGYETIAEDPGLYAITQKFGDWGKFRTPSLREVAKTAPYMHNGMLTTLDDVVSFYNNGGGTAKNKSSLLKPLNLNADEQKDLVAFLKALSGKDPALTPPPELDYQLRPLGKN
jgi:cytochrome c peroxidase